MTPRAMLAHYTAVIQLVRFLIDDQTGGVFGSTVEMITKVTSAKGVMAYRVEGRELVLVAESGLPRRAKAWLAHLPIDDQPWFIAQRVAVSKRGEVSGELADSRMGHSIRPALEAEGWRGLACAPIRTGTDLYGVLVLATGGTTFDKQTLLFLDAISGVLGLASANEAVMHQGRDDTVYATKTAELAALGLLASALSSEMADPLGEIEAGLAELEELMQLGTTAGMGAVHANIRSAVDGARSAVSRLDSIAQGGATESVELGSCVQQTLAVLAAHIEERGVALSFEPADAPIYVEGRVGALNMLVVQLVLYATDECAAAQDERREIRLSLSSDAGSCVLEVDMSGSTGQRSGARIFDGMLRGKSSGAATGLSLAVQTVAAHEGTIDVGTSQLGGELIRVLLPETLAVEPVSQPSAHIPEPPRAAAGAPHISRAGVSAAPSLPRPAPAARPLPPVPPRAAPPPAAQSTPPPRERPGARTPLKLDFDVEDSTPELSDELELDLVLDTPPPPARTAFRADTASAFTPSPRAAATQQRLIVWIDDDLPFLRGMARSITTHETLLVGSVGEAIELFDDLDVLPELILCDVALPDGVGTELHQTVDPQLAERFVFVTGGVIGKEAADYLKTCGRPTLIKPISVEEVHKLLQSTPTNPPPAQKPVPAPRRQAPSLPYASELAAELELSLDAPDNEEDFDW